MTGTKPAPVYVLEHADEELRRLEAQGAFLRAPTREFLSHAGIEPGMRVLDVGCGAGDVSFLAAELVGPSGEVTGVDRAEAAVSAATARARAKGTTNVRFLPGELGSLDELASGRRFDAVVGRLVLIHHPSPGEAIAQVSRLVRPGGVVAFQEIDLDAGFWSTRPLPALEQLWKTVHELGRRKVFASNLAGAFDSAFDTAGLVGRRIVRTGAIEGSSETGVYEWLGGFVRTLSSVVGPMGIPHELEPGTYAARLRAEVKEGGAMFIPAHFIGAAGRLPGKAA